MQRYTAILKAGTDTIKLFVLKNEAANSCFIHTDEAEYEGFDGGKFNNPARILSVVANLFDKSPVVNFEKCMCILPQEIFTAEVIKTTVPFKKNLVDSERIKFLSHTEIGVKEGYIKTSTTPVVFFDSENRPTNDIERYSAAFAINAGIRREIYELFNNISQRLGIEIALYADSVLLWADYVKKTMDLSDKLYIILRRGQTDVVRFSRDGISQQIIPVGDFILRGVLEDMGVPKHLTTTRLLKINMGIAPKNEEEEHVFAAAKFIAEQAVTGAFSMFNDIKSFTFAGSDLCKIRSFIHAYDIDKHFVGEFLPENPYFETIGYGDYAVLCLNEERKMNLNERMEEKANAFLKRMGGNK